uniref:Uncharacterized protein n=1 Tax=Eptatretus burgeri TaxID=7764 RepID=A0A8C4Q283_EPTBU
METDQGDPRWKQTRGPQMETDQGDPRWKQTRGTPDGNRPGGPQMETDQGDPRWKQTRGTPDVKMSFLLYRLLNQHECVFECPAGTFAFEQICRSCGERQTLNCTDCGSDTCATYEAHSGKGLPTMITMVVVALLLLLLLGAAVIFRKKIRIRSSTFSHLVPLSSDSKPLIENEVKQLEEVDNDEGSIIYVRGDGIVYQKIYYGSDDEDISC